MKKYILTSILSISTLLLQGQDIHFSQYFSSPLTLNPANTGNFNGNIRLVANYRSQWGSFTVPYQTFSGSADFAMLKGKLNGDFFGLGILFYHDIAGDSRLGTLNSALSLAYHKTLGDKMLMSVGAQVGFMQNRIDYTDLVFDNEYFFGDGNTGENFTSDNFLNLDVNAGINWYYAPSQ